MSTYPKHTSLNEIITLLKNKEEKGLSLLYDKYAASLLGIITHIVKSKNLGEEILQSTFLKVWNNIDQYNPDKGSFFSWISMIARNSAIDQIRLKGYQNRKNIDSIEGVTGTLGATTIQTDGIDTTALLATLDPKYKEVLDLVYLQGYTQRDAAESLDIPLGTVKTRLRMAIMALRSDLKGEEKLFFGTLLLITLLMLMQWI